MNRSLILLISFVFSSAVFAAIDAHEFESEHDRQRYRTLIDELRCPKCLNQNLSDSNSQIAIDLRNEVAKKVIGGESNQEIVTFMVDRYGDFVLYRPPMQNNTLVLWLGPTVMFGIGIIVFGIIIYRRTRATSEEKETSSDS